MLNRADHAIFRHSSRFSARVRTGSALSIGDLQQISGIGAQHRFARLKGGTILIVGEEGLVAAMIGPGER
jgi:hypothetical protein